MGFLGRAMESILGNLILGDQLPVACSLGGGGVGGAGIILGDPRPGTKTQKIPTSLERSARSDSGGSDSGARSLGGGGVGGARIILGDLVLGDPEAQRGRPKGHEPRLVHAPDELERGGCEFAAGTHSMRGGPELKHCWCRCSAWGRAIAANEPRAFWGI